jgi:hypothetical protein
MKTQSVKLDIVLQARDTKLKQSGLSQAAEARITFSEAIFFAIIAAVVHYRYSHLTPPRTHSLESNIGSYQVDVNLALSIEQTPVEPFKSSHLLARLIHVFFCGGSVLYRQGFHASLPTPLVVERSLSVRSDRESVRTNSKPLADVIQSRSIANPFSPPYRGWRDLQNAY